jgi:exosortase C (VPDSG-CTERM-specific)
MTQPPPPASPQPHSQALQARPAIRTMLWLLWIALATLAFAPTLLALTRYAGESELLSYIPLVPAVSLYLLYVRRGALNTAYRSSLFWALALGAIGAAALAAGLSLRASLSLNDYLALTTLAYVSLIATGGFLFLGAKWMVSAAFPMAFLIFMVPLPDAAVHALERASVVGSAEVSAFLFRITGTPLLRNGTIFVIPGIVLEIARECSGINSSWMLFITSLVASNLFLTSPWRRLVLVLFVFPLAIVRNSIRILTIGLLCVHIGPHMIDSFIHRRGGPIFFALSLVPLFLLLVWLRRKPR